MIVARRVKRDGTVWAQLDTGEWVLEDDLPEGETQGLVPDEEE